MTGRQQTRATDAGIRLSHLSLTGLIVIVATLAILPSPIGAALAIPGVLLCGVLFYLPQRDLHERLRREIAELQTSKRWNDELFERSGIALWREDWTAARDAVYALLRSGVYDVESYFAAHPDEARDIRRRVIVKDVNSFAVAMMGASDKSRLLGPLDRLLPDTDQTFIQWLIAFERGDAFYRSETHIRRPDGTDVDCLFTAALPSHWDRFEDVIVSALDISDYRAAQQRLVLLDGQIARTSRAATMGALSASIAQEVNSPLAAIMFQGEAALRWLERPQPDLAEARSAICSMLGDATRARAVVDRTRAYLDGSPLRRSPIRVDVVAREAAALLDQQLRDFRTSIHMDFPDELPVIVADEVQLQQVFINLLFNAGQAMSGNTTPRDIVVAARPQGSNLLVSVTDSGPGIAPDVLPDIFRPFYSTRPSGMAMGLAVCSTCIATHGGRLWAENVEGAGASFQFTLPLATQANAPPLQGVAAG